MAEKAVGKGAMMTTDPMEVPRYKKFAYMIATGESLTAARRDCQVGGDTSLKLLKDPKVLNYIQQIRNDVEQELKVERKDVLKGYLHAIRQADIQSDPKTQIQGWDSVARLEGLNAPEKHEHRHEGEVTHRMQKDIESMSTEELEELASADANAIEGEFSECPAEKDNEN